MHQRNRKEKSRQTDIHLRKEIDVENENIEDRKIGSLEGFAAEKVGEVRRVFIESSCQGNGDASVAMPIACDSYGHQIQPAIE